MEKIILIKYGELTTKKNNRNIFINTLCENIKKQLKNYNIKIIKNRVRMFIEVDDSIVPDDFMENFKPNYYLYDNNIISINTNYK